MEFSEIFVREHGFVWRALRVLEEMTEQFEIGGTVGRHDVNALLLFLHYFVDTFHQTKEEEILFPALEQSTTTIRIEDNIRRQLEDLLRGHSDKRSLIERTQAKLFSERPAEFVETAKELIRLLSEHMRNEEEVVFPLAEKVLTKEEADQVAAQMKHADGDFGYSQRKLLTQLLAELEQKYLTRAA